MLIELERVLQAALASDTPIDTLRESSRGLSPEALAFLERLDPEGFIVASLLVRKLRFERICRGDAELEQGFGRDPAGFTELFRLYNKEVPARAFFPQPEAAAFRDFLSRKGRTL